MDFCFAQYNNGFNYLIVLNLMFWDTRPYNFFLMIYRFILAIALWQDTLGTIRYISKTLISLPATRFVREEFLSRASGNW